MGKLIGQLFKEDIKTVLACMLMPLILGIAGMALYAATGLEALFAIVAIGATAMVFGPLVSIVFLSNNDNKRFYKDGASFYTCLPYGSEKINLARLINFVIMGAIILVISIVNIFAFAATSSSEALTFGDLISEIGKLFGSIKPEIWLAIIKSLVIAIGAGLVFAQMIMSMNTLAASNPFNKLGKIANSIIFIILFIGQGYLYLKVFGMLLDSHLIRTTEVIQGNGQVTISAFDFSLGSFLIVILVMVVFNLLYFGMINYFHKKKISVQ